MPPLYLHQEFPSLRAFKEALYNWAIEARFEPRILKSDTCRVRVGCKTDPNCPFIIRCNFDTERKRRDPPVAIITVLKHEHTCENNGSGALNGGNAAGGAANSKGRFINRSTASRLPFLVENVPRLLQVTPDTKPNDIREAIMKEYGYELHLQQCRRAKAEILKALENPVDDQVTPMLDNNDDQHMDSLPPPTPQGQNFQSPHLGNPMAMPSQQSLQPQTYQPSPAPMPVPAPQPARVTATAGRGRGQNQRAAQRQNQIQARAASRSQSMQANHAQLQTQNLQSQIQAQHPQVTSHLQNQQQRTPNIQQQTRQMHASVKNPQNAIQNQQQTQQSQNQPPPQDASVSLQHTYSTPTQLRNASTDGQIFQTQTPGDSNGFQLQPAAVPPGATPMSQAVSTPAVPTEQPIRCPYCVNQRWLKSIKDAVDHLSMHVVI